jgi:hypothetical protein
VSPFARGDLDHLSPRQAVLAVLVDGPRTAEEVTQELCQVRFRWDVLTEGDTDSPTLERVQAMLDLLDEHGEVSHVGFQSRTIWDIP